MTNIYRVNNSTKTTLQIYTEKVEPEGAVGLFLALLVAPKINPAKMLTTP